MPLLRVVKINHNKILTLQEQAFAQIWGSLVSFEAEGK